MSTHERQKMHLFAWTAILGWLVILNAAAGIIGLPNFDSLVAGLLGT